MLTQQTTAPQVFSTPLSEKQEGLEHEPILHGYLRREDLAKQLGVSPRTIDRWQMMRMGPPRVHIGRTILYSAESVREWLRSKEQTSPRATRRRYHR
jgi:predicted DNA-binding transcriptional regulator AlpA